MKKAVIGLSIVAIGFGVYWFVIKDSGTAEAPKQQAVKVEKHSSAFNNSVDSALNTYFSVKTAFVDADTSLVKKNVQAFISQLERLPLDDLKKDSTLVADVVKGQLMEIKANAAAIISGNDLTTMRKDFSSLNESIYPFLKAIHYSGNTLYWQNCPMAFGENQPANWISNTAEIVNPYMGKNHPEYKGTMLHCGEVLDSIKGQ